MINFAENLNKMITAGLGGETEAPKTEVAVGHRIQYLDASGPVASFDTNIIDPLKKLLVTMLPIQAGSGDPSPENIRPISGRDILTVKRTGKNLLNSDISAYITGRSYKYINGVVPDGQVARFTFIDKDTTVDISGINIGFLQNDLTKTQITGAYRWALLNGEIAQNTSNVSTVGYICSNVFLYPNTDEAFNALFARYDIMVELGSTATEYEDFHGDSVALQLGDTVYGGTLDVPAGKLMVTMGFIASYAGESLPGEWISDRDVYTPGATPTARAQVCYELAEPVEIDLEPQQITTLIGDNNIWSDSGDVDVTYIYYEETEGY